MNLTRQIIDLLEEKELDHIDRLALEACGRAVLQDNLSEDGQRVINECVQSIREKLKGFTEEEDDWFNRCK